VLNTEYLASQAKVTTIGLKLCCPETLVFAMKITKIANLAKRLYRSAVVCLCQQLVEQECKTSTTTRLIKLPLYNFID
jgi:hypothetical protein